MRLLSDRGTRMSNEELVSQIQQGVNTCSNMELLYMNNKPYIFQIAKKYSNYTDIEDLMQEAYFGLYEAVQRYENNHEVKFMTYAGYWIHQTIARYAGNHENTVRMPLGLKDIIYKYKEYINLYKIKLGRIPSDNKLCTYLGVNSKKLKSIKLALHQYDRMKSLNDEIPGEDGEGIALGDAIAGKVDLENDLIDNLMEKKVRMELWQIVKENTTKQENEALIHRYKKNMTLRDVANTMNISFQRVRQLEQQGLKKLRLARIRRDIQERFEINNARSYRGSFKSFNYDWTSSTERVALKNIELESKIL